MAILFFVNISYFISCYFAYYNFELTIMDKIGAQPKFINMYSWIQFQISTVKCDLGLIIYFAISFTFGVNQSKKLNYVLFTLDILMVLISIGITIGLNYYVYKLYFYIFYLYIYIKFLLYLYYIFIILIR
jgi:hypothetical protein